MNFENQFSKIKYVSIPCKQTWYYPRCSICLSSLVLLFLIFLFLLLIFPEICFCVTWLFYVSFFFSLSLLTFHFLSSATNLSARVVIGNVNEYDHKTPYKQTINVKSRTKMSLYNIYSILNSYRMTIRIGQCFLKL